MYHRTVPDATPVANRLHSASLHLIRRIRTVDAEMGVSAPRLSALSVLVFGGPRTIGELAEAEQVRQPSMTALVNGLEAEGLARRAADPDDGRVVRVHATAKGKRLLLRGRDRRVEALTELLDGLSESQLRTLDRAARLIEELSSRAWPSDRS
jgi:DNA-binding MarR family transcriptional regulator